MWLWWILVGWTRIWLVVTPRIWYRDLNQSSQNRPRWGLLWQANIACWETQDIPLQKKDSNPAILWSFGANIAMGMDGEVLAPGSLRKIRDIELRNFTLYIYNYIYIFHCLDYAGVQSNVMSGKRMDCSKASSKPLTSICNKPLATTPKTGLHDPASWRGERVRETT